MTVSLSPVAGAGWQFFDNNGVPLSGGLIYTYLAGTSTPAATYTTNAGSVSNANPIVLDSSGRPSNEIWLSSNLTYKFILQTSAGTQIWSADNIYGIAAPTGIESSATATAGQTVFTGLSYAVGNNSMKVYVNGSKQIVTLNYTETNSTTITFVSGLNAGDVVEFLQ